MEIAVVVLAVLVLVLTAGLLWSHRRVDANATPRQTNHPATA